MNQLVLIVATIVLAVPLRSFADEESKSQKIAELMQLEGLDGVLEQQRNRGPAEAEAVKAQVVQQLRDQFGELPRDVWDRFDAAYARFLAGCRPAWTSQEAVQWYADLYGAQLTEDDVDQILVFMKSPIGRKSAAASLGAVAKWTTMLTEKNQKQMQTHLHAFFSEVKQIATTCRERIASKSPREGAADLYPEQREAEQAAPGDGERRAAPEQ